MFNNASNTQIDNGTFNNVGRDQYNIQNNFPVVPGAMTDLSLYSTHLQHADPLRLLDNELQKLAKWISPLDFSEQQDAAHEKRTEGTGTWLLRSPGFNGWVDGEAKILWCPGKRAFFWTNG